MLLRLAVPVVLGQLGLMAMNITDLLVVGRLGGHATGVVGVGTSWIMAALAFGIGASAGIDPLVAQAYGAQRPELAVTALQRGAVVVGLLCVPMIAAHWWAAPLLTALGQPAELIPDAAAYCRVLAAGVPPFFAFQLLRQFLQGSGRMGAATVAVVVGNVANLIGAWLLVYGGLGLTGMGPVGAAWSTLIVRWLMAAVLAVEAWPVIADAWPGIARGWGPLGAVAAVMLPVGLQISLEMWAFNVAAFMAGWLGGTASAAHTVALSLASTSFMVPLGVSAAAATRVGNLVGAGQPWRRSAWTALGLGSGVMLGSAALYAGIPAQLAALYNRDPAVIAAAAAILPIAALFQVFDGTQAVGFGVLRGLGDTRVPALANIVGYGLFGLPLGYVLAFRLGWGLPGVWLGLTAGLATVAALLVARIHSTRS